MSFFLSRVKFFKLGFNMKTTSKCRTESTSSSQKKFFIHFDLECALEAGAIIKEAFYEKKDVLFKASTDLVTKTDKECENLIMNKVMDHHFDDVDPKVVPDS